jgi:hypothetical protein
MSGSYPPPRLDPKLVSILCRLIKAVRVLTTRTNCPQQTRDVYYRLLNELEQELVDCVTVKDTSDNNSS